MKIGIVLLNYLNWKDTIECIESLKSQTNQNFEVVIVDNNSGNESVSEFEKKYGDEENIHILENNDNLGFAKGNNTGILFCKNKLNIQNILVANNDVIFTDEGYIDYLIHYPVGENIGVLGTEIIGSDGKNQNPIKFRPSFLAVLREFSAPILFSKPVNIIRKVRNNIREKQHDVAYSSQKITETPYILHGSVLYFTENYLSKMNGFYPETFLYYEEEILGLICKKLGLDMNYDPSKSIYHKEDQSSEMSFQNLESVKRKFARRSVRIGLKVSLLSEEKLVDLTNAQTYTTQVLKKNMKTELLLKR